ncbi:hypothetical protein NDA11_003644 [Ustilago hordei]|uniref:Uncharacterized protein n=1 Tax=Ustilago hordei TaxID=120017 RepID=I2FMV4_USTHO|nr:uncharacterized protein UHO2_04790 [Ustilago hordei]KAJ1041843.1 hypothetical protein NDA10_000637 [Ustilago hordei]KAJ1595154.1 hypothetical protein NDA11_003644 [Ustilago hordei]KAJ1597094.1 hypothetical protein NDA14_005591 [Ustilago hordei]UTT89518.1 hypothetical protein NDA17_000702 [Ustilago hordei]CCF48247.1 uncharacterized protein UHOR_05946 [Ustilago hordei]
MQLTCLLISASLLLSSAFAAPAASFGTSSPAQLMLKRQYESVNYDTLMLGRDAAEPLGKRIVYNPHITQPTASTVWVAGNTYHVKWDTSDQPPEAANYTGIIKLGFIPESGQGGYNLHWTLADGFLIRDGKTSITLPQDLEERNDYIVVVLGDSGNKSDKFTIKKARSLVDGREDQNLGEIIEQNINDAFEQAGMQ